ncbi:MAG: T9SS type A sorting domain-containing protein [Saprospirales bacterium]|nr:T9SS type A sorting domain-containing protein [Saprospirales bacterium]
MKNILRLCLFALPALLPHPAHAQQDFWEPCGGPLYGSTSALALHPDGDMFAGSTVSGVYRSTDGGNSWKQALDYGFAPWGDFVRDIALNTQGHVFAAYNTAIYRSIDKGENWVEKSPGLGTAQVWCFAVNLHDHLLAGATKGLYRSTDNGDTWPPADIRLDSLWIRDLFLHPAGHVFAGTNAGLFRSTDGGNTWNGPLLSAVVHAGAADASGYVFAAADSSLYRSADNGDTWEPLLWNSGQINVLAFTAGGQLLAGSATGLFVSADQGGSWQAAGLDGRTVTALAFNAGNALVAGTDPGVFLSSDNGNSWRPANKGLGNTYPNQFAESAGGFLFTSTTGGYSGGRAYIPVNGPAVYRSADEGNSWEAVFSGEHNYEAVHVTPSGHILAQEGRYSSSGYFTEMYRSADQGQSWEYTEFLGVAEELVNTADGYILVAASGFDAGSHGGFVGGIYKSSDNGFIWDSLYRDFDLNTFSMSNHYCLTIDAQGDIFAGISYWPEPDSVKIIRSADGGQTWAPASGGIPPGDLDTHVLSLAADSGGRLFAGLSNGLLFRSENKGASWDSLDLNAGGASVNDLAIDASDHIFAATANGVFYSTDHGASWDSLNSGLSNLETKTLFIAKNGRLFVGTAGGGAFRSAAPVSAVGEAPGSTVPADALGQIYPNPLREQASIPFSIATPGRVRLAVYDMTGREMLVLFDGDYTPGNYEAAFQPGGLPAGVYFYSLSTQSRRLTRKLLIVR